MNRPRVLAFGELLWDIIGEERHLGGAPLNSAANLALLGCETRLISAAGDDELGREAIKALSGYGVGTEFIARSALPTGRAIVTLAEDGSASYDLPAAAYDKISLDDAGFSRLADFGADAMVFGTLALYRSRQNRELFDKINREARPRLLFYDVNLRLDFFDSELVSSLIAEADIIKLNEDEAARLSALLFGKELDAPGFCAAISEKFGEKLICVTMGEKGCFVFEKGAFARMDGLRVKVADTVGAGDAFGAAFLFTYLMTGDAAESAWAGNIAGAFAASHSGAVMEFDHETARNLGALPSL